MTVKELIEKLQELDPELPVWILSDGFESEYSEVMDVDIIKYPYSNVNNGDPVILIQ